MRRGLQAHHWLWVGTWQLLPPPPHACGSDQRAKPKRSKGPSRVSMSKLVHRLCAEAPSNHCLTSFSHHSRPCLLSLFSFFPTMHSAGPLLLEAKGGSSTTKGKSPCASCWLLVVSTADLRWGRALPGLPPPPLGEPAGRPTLRGTSGSCSGRPPHTRT